MHQPNRTEGARAGYPTLGELWDEAMACGIEVGYRDAESVWSVCRRHRARYARLSAPEKRRFDKTRLTVPFGDCRMYAGRRGDRIRGLLAGIDATPDMALRINELVFDGWPIDLLFAHHGGSKEMIYTSDDYLVPDARCLARAYGLPVKALRPVEAEARRRMRERNPDYGGTVYPGWRSRFMRVSGAAEMCRQIGVAQVNVHTPCDAIGWRAVWEVLREARPAICGDAIEALYRIPEYRRYRQQRQLRIRMAAGAARNPLGRWYDAMCAATLNLTEASIRALKAAGFQTLVGVFTECPVARQIGLNVIALPHDPSDAIGINGMLDRFVGRWPKLEILTYGELLRVERPRLRAWTEALI